MARKAARLRCWSFMLGVFVCAVVPGLSLLSANAACIVPPSGLVSWWSGNGTFSDSAGGGNIGSPGGALAFAPGEAGGAFSFDGSTAYVQVGPQPSLSVGLTCSFEFWIYPTGPGSGGNAGGIIVNKENEYEVARWSDGSIQWAFANTAPGFAWINTGAKAPTNVWTHIAVTYTNGIVKTYTNGALAQTYNGSGAIVAAANDFRIGGRQSTSQYFQGLIDEVSVYNRALDSTEVAGLFNAGSAGKCGGPVTSGGLVPYFTDFESGIGSEWGLNAPNRQETLGFTSFSGRFGNVSQTLFLGNLVPGQAYTVGFDLYALDSLDGNGGGDFFNVAVNAVQVFHYTFSNYNGNPPNSPQSFPGLPDEGRANFGFQPSYVDAIYRNIEITFVASNTLATISFSGQNLQTIDDESWGIDNVSVRLTADLTNTIVHSTTLPPAGSTNSVAIENFTISASHPLLASTATNAASYILREAGTDGIFNTGDDVLYNLALSIPGVGGGHSVALALTNGPLQFGHYQFQTTAVLKDTNSISLPAFTRDFYIFNPVLGAIETPGNDTLIGATPLPVAESPASSGFYTAFGVGTFSNTSDVDYWRFDAEAGDVITVRLESESLGLFEPADSQCFRPGSVIHRR